MLLNTMSKWYSLSTASVLLRCLPLYMLIAFIDIFQFASYFGNSSVWPVASH